jgi:hypothetical protein
MREQFEAEPEKREEQKTGQDSQPNRRQATPKT